MAGRIRKAGEFCWMNMLTAEPAQAREFYATLLGWTYVEMPGIGHRVQVGGRDIGALFDVDGPNTPRGTKPHIGVMVKVDSADAIGEKAKSLGGTARPAFDIQTAGRMAVCGDPNGASFDVWEPKKMLGTDIDASLHGAPNWHETLTSDVDRAKTFYCDLFGWTAEPHPTSDVPYTVCKLGDTPVAGMMAITPEMRSMKPRWWTYFTVDDADRAASTAVKLGATICMPLRDIPGVGRIGGIVSPQGVTFYIIKHDR